MTASLKLWILEENDYIEGYWMVQEVVGVFSTLQLAQDYAERFYKDYTIKEVKVDVPIQD